MTITKLKLKFKIKDELLFTSWKLHKYMHDFKKPVGTTLHIRVNATNSCGTSAWQVKQGTTPLTPIYPGCNGN